MKDINKDMSYRPDYWFNTLVFTIVAFIIFSCGKGNNDTASGASSMHDEHQAHVAEQKEKIYYCPMDTQIVQNKPGICPICEMDLELKEEHSDHKMHQQKDWVYRPVNIAVLSSVKSIRPQVKSLPVTVKASGYITYDTKRIYSISSNTEGRVEKLYVKYKFQPVKKGQPLLDLYSHELLSAQQDYLYLKNSDADESLLKAGRNKLLLLGMSESQVNHLKDDGNAHATTTLYSPYSGYVIEEENDANAYTPPSTTTGSMGGGMTQGAAMNESTSEKLILKEGAYVKKGGLVFKVANTDKVWAVFEVFSDQVARIKKGQMIHMYPENSSGMLMSYVDFIEPVYGEQSGRVKFRVYMDNKDQRLKIGNLISGEISVGSKKALWIPQTSVYDLGNEKVVFVKKGEAFVTKGISIGAETEKFIEVISGLNESDEIAENAQFMIDSESFVKVEQE